MSVLASMPLQNLADLPSIWRQVPDFTAQAPIQRIQLNAHGSSQAGWIALSAPLDVLLLQWVWFGGQEDKHWLLHLPTQSIWLCARDRRELFSFYGDVATRPLFRPLADQPSLIEFANPSLCIHQVSSDQERTLLVPMRPFNEYSSTHFGHFVVELMPLLLVASHLQMTLLLSRSLPVWAQELLHLAGLSALIERCRSFKAVADSSCALGRCDLRAGHLRAQLVKLQPELAAALMAELACDPLDHAVAAGRQGPVVVLSRSHLPRHRRWMNEEHLLRHQSRYRYVQLKPEELGVFGLRDRLQALDAQAVVMAIGSAAYQLFLDARNQRPVILLCGCMNPDAPSKWLSTYLPFRKRFWLLFQRSGSNAEWNMPFQHSPVHIEQAVVMALSGRRPRQLLRCDHNTWILPPDASMGAAPSFGVDFG